MIQPGYFDLSRRYASLDAKPDAKFYREALSKDAPALFEAYLRQQGYLAMSGQIVDATIVPVPKHAGPHHRHRAGTHRNRATEPDS